MITIRGHKSRVDVAGPRLDVLVGRVPLPPPSASASATRPERSSTSSPRCPPTGGLSLGSGSGPSATLPVTPAAPSSPSRTTSPPPPLWTIPACATRSTLAGPLRASLHLAAELADAKGSTVDVLLALTGRRPLPQGFSVL